MPRLLLIYLGLLTVNLLPAQSMTSQKLNPKSTEIHSYTSPKSIKKGVRKARVSPKKSFRRTVQSRKIALTKKQKPQWETKGYWSAPKNKRRAQFRYLAKNRKEWR